MARQQGNISAKKVSTAKKIDPAPSQLNNTAEMRDWYQKNKKNIENYAAAMEGAKSLRDITKTSTKAVTAYSKDSLRTYLQNIGSNEKNLRNLSRYLYYRCHAYYRLIAYNANMFCLDARSVIPEYDMVAGVDTNAMLSSYQDTLNVLDKLNLQYEFLKAYTICFREDVFYGCAYYDEIGMFILPLDPDYCKISGIYNTGDFAFVMDMSYFRSRQTMLELWGEPFQSMYRAYESDTTNGKWQPMPDEYAICLKARAEDWETVVPPFSGLLSGIINLIDLDDLQAIADAQDNAEANQEKYMESTAGKLQAIKTQMQDFWVNFYNSGTVNGVLEFVHSLTEGFTSLEKTLGPIPALLTAVFAAMTVKNATMAGLKFLSGGGLATVVG